MATFLAETHTNEKKWKANLTMLWVYFYFILLYIMSYIVCFVLVE
jgi:hypothetical protein